MPMTGASMYWLDALHDCRLDQPLSLPYDRYRLSNEHRSGRATSVSFDLGQDLSHHLLTYASSNNLSLEHLTLSIYFVFLFKLSNGESDLCIGMNTHGRYRDELQSIIGLFENVIPVRCQLDPHQSFRQLLDDVSKIASNSMKYSYYPLQRILSQHPTLSKTAFLDISFEFLSSLTKDEKNEVMIGDSRFSSPSFSIETSEDEIMSKFDFILSMHHSLSTNQLSGTINASLDLFNPMTVATIAQQFHSFLHQLSTSSESQLQRPIYDLSLTLSSEQLLVQSLNNTQTSFSPTTCIHHAFACRVMQHPQKLAVELDDQSLTYAELLHNVQRLSLHLLDHYGVVPGGIICQCVERSLSMVSRVEKCLLMSI